MTKTIPSQVQKRIEKMVDAFRIQLTELYQWSNSDEYEPKAVDIEDRIRKWVHSKDVESGR
jgi:hypothetical protein